MGERVPGAPEEGILSKGVNLVHLREFTQSRFGEEAWHQVLDRVKPETREIFFRRIHPSARYAYGSYVDVLQVVVARFLGGDIRRAAEIGAYDMEASLNTIYRALYRVGSPSIIIRMSARLWRLYFNVGSMVIEEVGRGFARARIDDFVPPAEVCCWDIQGSIVRALELSGASDVKTEHTECPLRGGATMRYDSTWTERG
jgi:hypothetical protein